MATITTLLADNALNITGQTVAGSLTNIIDGAERAKVINELLLRGIKAVADTTALSATSGADFRNVAVKDNALYEWLASGTANGTTIFAASGGGVWSKVFSAGVAAAQLATPVLTLEVISDDQINATWESVTDAVNYQLYRSVNSDYSGETLIYDGALLLFNSTGLDPETIYYFRLRARGYERLNSAFDSDSAETQAMPQLATPTLVATPVSSSQIDIAIGTVADGEAFIIEWSADGISGWTELYNEATAGTFNHTGLDELTEYFYRGYVTATGFQNSDYATDSATTDESVIIPAGAILILQAGQSNAVGRGQASAPDEITVPSGVFEYNPISNTISNLADPTGQDYTTATVRSMNPQLGKRIKELTGQDVIICPVAKGNTGIDIWLTPGNAEAINALAWWNGLKTFCVANDITVGGMYGHLLQGENDAQSAMPVDTYATKLNQWVNLFIDDYGLEMVFVTRIGYSDVSLAVEDESREIMKAQKALNLSKDQMICTTFAASTFVEGDTAISGNRVHYTLKGLNIIGEDVAEAIQNYRTNNKKVDLSVEPVTELQDPVGYFDDIYNFRALNNFSDADLTEIFGRNNLTAAAGTPVFDGKNGLEVLSNISLTPATARELLDSHDWSIEFTGRIATLTSAMLLNGRASGAYNEDWVWIDSTSSLSLKGNGVVKNVTLTGANLLTLTNLVITWETSIQTLKVYVNGGLVHTSADWAYTALKIDSFLRGYLASPTFTFRGVVERLRVVKKILAPYEFDRSPNIETPPVIDWTFNFNGDLLEENGLVSGVYKNYDLTDGTPSYESGAGLVCTRSAPYLQLNQTFNTAEFDIEFRAKFVYGVSPYQVITGPSPRVNNQSTLASCIRINNVLSSYMWFEIVGKTWILSASFDTTVFHTYRITQSGGVAELFIDGVSQGTKSTATTPIVITSIGAGYTTQATNMDGVLDYITLKNFV